MFFYGTLCHAPLLDLVLGRKVADRQAAHLDGYRVVWVRDRHFPMIVAAPGARAEGILVRGLDQDDQARLRFYESGFRYDPRRVGVATDTGATQQALVFFPDEAQWQPGAPWSLDDWAAQWAEVTLRAAQEVMEHFGHLSEAEIAQRYPWILRRAASWVAMRQRPADPDWNVQRDVRIESREQVYSGFHATEEMVLRHRLFDGGLGDPIRRVAQMVGNAAVVLPYDPVQDAVLLVQQFRAPVFAAGDPMPWVWEPVAGLVDPGETPAQTGCREAVEEAGLTLTRLESAGEAYSSTGSSSEFVSLFIGVADFSQREGGGGVEDEGEDIRPAVIPYAAFIADVDGGRYKDMPLLVTAHWLARNRARLRAMA